jgi:hypothetical protein
MSITEKLNVEYTAAQSEMNDLIDQGINTSEKEPADYEIDFDEMSVMDEPVCQGNRSVEIVDDCKGVSVPNQEYMDSKIKELIFHNVELMKTLRDDIANADCAPNMKPRMMEIHGSITNSVSMLLRELREISKLRIGIDVIPFAQLIRSKAEKPEEPESKNDTLVLSSSQLLKIINEAKKENKINAEEAVYEEILSDPGKT